MTTEENFSCLDANAQKQSEMKDTHVLPEGCQACAPCTCTAQDVSCAKCCGCTHVSSLLPDQQVCFLGQNKTFQTQRSRGAAAACVFRVDAVPPLPPGRHVLRISSTRNDSESSRLYESFLAKARVLGAIVQGCALGDFLTAPSIANSLRTISPTSCKRTEGRFAVSGPHVLVAEARGCSLC